MDKPKGSVSFRGSLPPESKPRLEQILQGMFPKEQSPREMEAEFYKTHPWSDPNKLSGLLYSPESANALYESYSARSPEDNLLAYMFTPQATAMLMPPESDITQRHFRYGDLDRMRDTYAHARNMYYAGAAPQNQGFVKNSPAVPYDRFVPYEEYSQLSFMPTMQSNGNPLREYVDQDYRLAPFTQGAYYTQEPEGTYLHNQYNVGGMNRNVNVLLPRSQR